MEQDDLRQEIAIAVWRALDRFRGDSSERTYVVRIARNRALTFSAQRARRRALVESLTLESLSSAHDLDTPSAADSLKSALHALPAAERSLLELSAAGYTPQQIASEQGRSPGAIRVALHRARTALRALMGAEPEER